MPFDVIIIGSGFGGAITACRLSQAGYKVLVLERGRRWDKTNFPRKPEDRWLWSHDRPEAENGWLDLRMFPGMSIASGAAVGGGSLIYANISCEAPPAVFTKGWCPEINYQELKPHYDTVASFMDVAPVPDTQWTGRMKLMRDAAVAAGFSDRFKKLDLAVSFNPEWTYENDYAKAEAGSTSFINKHGAPQGTCVHLGNCDIGCDVLAKNTLDRNYLYVAENQCHAEIRPLHLVDRIEPLPNGSYRVSYDSLETGQRVPGSETARILIVAAGSLGSTELLLRARDIHKTLPKVSQTLGLHWSGNGDFLTPAIYRSRDVEASERPTTIASAIDFQGRQISPAEAVLDPGRRHPRPRRRLSPSQGRRPIHQLQDQDDHRRLETIPAGDRAASSGHALVRPGRRPGRWHLHLDQTHCLFARRQTRSPSGTSVAIASLDQRHRRDARTFEQSH